MSGKRRTRQHVIADLGVNFLEKQVLLAGFTLLREQADYGYDAFIRTFNDEGEVEDGHINVQVKATDNPQFSDEHAGFAYDLSIRDLSLWLNGFSPMILVLYDASKDLVLFKNVEHDTVVRIPVHLKSKDKMLYLDVLATADLLTLKGVIAHRDDLAKIIEQTRLGTRQAA